MSKSRLVHSLAILSLLVLPIPRTHADDPSPALEQLAHTMESAELRYGTDFQTDCRAEFQSTGQVDWQPGQLTLQPGATISKEVNGNWQGEWQFDLACEPVPADTTSEFVFQVTMNDGATPWQLVWQVSPTGKDNHNGTLTLFNMRIQKEHRQLLKLKQSPLTSFTGSWQVCYSSGVVEVQHNGQRVLAGYIANGPNGIRSGQWQSKQVQLTLTSWQHRSCVSLELTAVQQIQQANQFVQAGIEAHSQGKYSESEPLLQKALAIREQAFGKDHPLTVSSLNNLAAVFKEQGKYSEAEPLYQRALAIYERTLGKEHPETARTLNNLAMLYYYQGKYTQAELLIQRALAIREPTLGKEHLQTAGLLNNLAALYKEQGKHTDAESLYLRALAIREQTLGKVDPKTAATLSCLAALYRAQGKHTEAEPLYLRALMIYERTLDKEHPQTAASLNNLAGSYLDLGKYTEAEPLFQRALVIHEQTLGKEHPQTAASLNNVALLFFSQGQYTQAEPLFLQAIQIQELNRPQLNDDRLARSQNERQFNAHHNVTKLYLKTQRPYQAWQFWEQSLGRGLLDELNARQLGTLAPEQKQQLQSLQTLCQSYSKILQDAADKPGISSAQRDTWQLQLRHHQAELAQLQHELASQSDQAILEGKVYSLADIQAHLLPHKALVGWLDLVDWHYGYVVRSTGEPFWIKLPGNGENERLSLGEVQLASQVVIQLSATDPSFLLPSYWQQLTDFLKQLQQQRLAPLHPALAEHDGLPAATHLIILPSAGMAGVPIETLVDAGTLVSYASSGTVFA